jgi:hypothetical protein
MRIILAAGLLIASVLASSASFAEMTKDARAKFVSSCQKQMYMSAPACGCMADIADKKLDDTAIEYLSLAATDVVHSAALSKSMTPKEVASIDMFMRTAPGQCKNAT